MEYNGHKYSFMEGSTLNVAAFAFFAMYHFKEWNELLYIGTGLAALSLLFTVHALFHLKALRMGLEGYGNTLVTMLFNNLIFSVLYLAIFYFAP